MTGCRLTVWGVRGSAPAAAIEYMGFGGNTVCTALDWGEDGLLALDAGSGLAGLGSWMLRQKRRRLDILLSHLHLDHLLGLLRCPLLYEPEAELHFYGWPGCRQSVEALMAPPYWPVVLSACPAKIYWHKVTAGEEFGLAGLNSRIQISTMAGQHPGGSLLYRLEGGGRSLVYALDNEFNDNELNNDNAFYCFVQNTDLLIWDASFAPGLEQAGWGHSTWEQGCAVARAAGVKALLCTHFGCSYEDSFLAEQERLAAEKFAGCIFAREGLTINI